MYAGFWIDSTETLNPCSLLTLFCYKRSCSFVHALSWKLCSALSLQMSQLLGYLICSWLWFLTLGLERYALLY